MIKSYHSIEYGEFAEANSCDFIATEEPLPYAHPDWLTLNQSSFNWEFMHMSEYDLNCDGDSITCFM